MSEKQVVYKSRLSQVINNTELWAVEFLPTATVLAFGPQRAMEDLAKVLEQYGVRHV